ncbi:MAG: FAD:protein FMN transferase [Bacteroidetes bacterium]|nr:FAD:protein FMN transferase [Bacteroidota bacterium]HET6245968.1 FAD:protein FMN transferase [Bacteroidia bacterium]
MISIVNYSNSIFRSIGFLILLVGFLFNSCNNAAESKKIIQGHAQGTTYSISYYSKDKVILKAEIDSLLDNFDLSLSTYVPHSIVSRINNNDSTVIVDNYFTIVFEKSMELAELSHGYFDVTIAPVVNAWGFGFNSKSEVDSSTIAQLLNIVGYKKVKLEDKHVIKENINTMLDFNAIAQGYSVDVLAQYFQLKGIKDFLIEIGGETRASGYKPNTESWKVGIDKPLENPEQRQLTARVKLNDKALATSGNYRKFYEENGNKFSHTINPHTGFPARNNLLSATVIAADCMSADAFATLFMVIGMERSLEFIKNHEELYLEVYFIYDDNGKMKSYFSEGLLESLEEFN